MCVFLVPILQVGTITAKANQVLVQSCLELPSECYDRITNPEFPEWVAWGWAGLVGEGRRLSYYLIFPARCRQQQRNKKVRPWHSHG